MTLHCRLEHEAADLIDIKVELDADRRVIGVTYMAISSLAVLRWLKKATTEWKGKAWDSIRISSPDIPNVDRPLVRQLLLSLDGGWVLPYEEAELCHCRSVPTPKVLRALRVGCREVEGVGRMTSAGTACGSCRKDSEKLIRYVFDIP